MSGILISYGAWGSDGLEDAASEAQAVSKKLTSYSDALNDDIYKKLNRYPGDSTSNISNALSSLKNKIDGLDDSADKYTTFKDDLNDLKETCKQYDSDVAKRVESLTADFKTRNNIKTNTVLDGINGLLTKVANKTAVGRWLNDGLDWLNDKTDSFLQSIEDWFDFKGGEAAVEGFLIGALEVVAAVAGIVAAIAALATGAAGLALVAAIAGLIGGTIALVNGVTNLINEKRALDKYKDDPACARRLSDENTIQDVMRSETRENIAAWDLGAGAIDTVKLVCDVIGIVKGGADLAKGLKAWSGTDGVFGNLKELGGQSLNEIKTAFRNRDFNIVKDALSSMKTNFKDSMWKFDSVKDGAKSIKSMAGIVKDGVNDISNLFDGDATLKDFADLGKDIFKHSIGNISLAGYQLDGENEVIKIADITDIGLDSFDGMSDLIELFGSGTSAIDISIPDIPIPDIDIRVTVPQIDIRVPAVDVTLAVA